MDKLKKFELMEKIIRELDDVKRSQQAVLEKIGRIEVENIELGDKDLEQKIPDIYERTANNADAIGELIEAFTEKKDEYSTQNNIEKLKEQQEIERSQNG